jgi:transposase
MKSRELQLKVVEAYKKGMPIKEIETTFRVSDTNLYDILDRFDIPRRRFLRPGETFEETTGDY